MKHSHLFLLTLVTGAACTEGALTSGPDAAIIPHRDSRAFDVPNHRDAADARIQQPADSGVITDSGGDVAALADLTRDVLPAPDSASAHRFFEMDLSKIPVGDLTVTHIKAIFGTSGGDLTARLLKDPGVRCIIDPFGSGKKVLRLRFPPSTGGNTGTGFAIGLFPFPRGTYEAYAALEIALSKKGYDGATHDWKSPASIHMPFFTSRNFSTKGPPTNPGMYAHTFQLIGSNDYVLDNWTHELFAGDKAYSTQPFAKSVDNAAVSYIYDNSGAYQRMAYPNLSDPTDNGTSHLPDAQQPAWKIGEYVTVENYVKMNDDKVANGAYRSWYNGKKSLDRSGIKLLADGHHEDLYLFSFTFWVGGPDTNPNWWTPPDREMYMYIRSFAISPTPITH